MSSRKMLFILSFIGVLLTVVVTFAFALRKAESYLTSKARHELGHISPDFEISLEKVSINPFSRMIFLKDVKVRSEKFRETLSIASIGVGHVDWRTIGQILKARKPVVPRQLTFAMRDLAIPAEWTGPTAAETLKSLGYETIHVSTSFALALDPVRKSFAISPFILNIKHAGRLDFTLGLANATMPTKEDIQLLKKNPKAFVTDRLPAYGDVSLSEISVDYYDDSLAKKASDFMVTHGEDHPIALLDLALAQAIPSRKTASAAAKTNGFAHQGLQQLKEFFKKPGTIGVRSSLAEPVPFKSLLDEKTGGSVDEIARKLSLEIERN